MRGWLRADARRPKSGLATTFSTRVRALCGAELPSYIDRQLQTIDFLSAQLRDSERELKALCKANSTCQRLMTVPGVGWLTALRYVATRGNYDCLTIVQHRAPQNPQTSSHHSPPATTPHVRATTQQTPGLPSPPAAPSD